MLQASLKVVGGKHDGEIIPLSSARFLIGRESDCDLRPNSDMVSRHHCAFTVDDYGVRLRDLGSTNGTIVNGERIRGVVQLNAGDEITVGKLEFALVIGDVGAAGTDESLQSETAELSAEDTHYNIPAATEGASADSSTTIQTPEQVPQPEPEVAAAAAPQPAMPQQPPAPPAYQQPGYPPQQQPMYYPPGMMGYPQPPGYYPQYPYPQPVIMQQPMGYPPQPMAPQQPPAPAPATPAPSADVPDVQLPDPATTGAQAAEQAAGQAAADGRPPATPEKNPSQHAADIIRGHLQRMPNVGE